MGEPSDCADSHEAAATAAAAAATPTSARPPDRPESAETDDGGIDGRWLVVAGIVALGATGAVVTRRKFLAGGAGAAAALTAPWPTSSRTASAEVDRPNILWFRSEDNSADLIGAYGNALARTPNIDRLAAEGVRFSNFFTTSPVCAPTKLGWATGMYEAGLGPGENMRASGHRPEFAVGFATWLTDAGYWCTTSGNVDYNTDLQGKSGFADDQGQWQTAATEGTPFLALLGSSTSHEVSMFSPSPGITDPAAVDLPAYVPDDPQLRADRAAYLDHVGEMDTEFGAVLAELDRLGVADDTIVIYSSDHGGVLPRSKRFCYDSGLHAPLIVRFPERWQHLAPSGPGTVVDTPVSSIDAAPTILHLAGIDIPTHFQGQPFAGETCAPRPFAFSNRNRMDEAIDFVRSVRDTRYRYVRNYMPHLPWGQHLAFMWQQTGYRRWEQLHAEGSLSEVQDRFWQPKPFEELYDLTVDPDEVTNLVDVGEHRERLDELRSALDEHMVRVNDNGFIPEGSAIEGWDQSRVPGAYPLERLLELGRLAGQRDPDHLPTLLVALEDDNAVVRYWGAVGCSILGELAGPGVDALRARMDDAAEDRWVRVQAADAAARATRDPAAITFLATVAGAADEPFPTRLQAVQSLVILGPVAAADSLAAIRSATTSPNEYVAAAAKHGVDVVSGTYVPGS